MRDMNTDVPAQSKESSDKAVVLCVDDEKPILSALNRLLRRSGYQVFLAESAPDALELLQRERVDVLISDMRMPKMNGAALLTQVAEQWPTIVRILLTGYAELTDAKQAEDEADIYCRIDKPWDDAKLLATINQSLQDSSTTGISE